MHDQAQALGGRGVAATFLAATLSSDEMRRRLGQLRSGAFKLAYVAPERLAFPGFRALLRELDVPLVAVDEAHCISEWGHDFRPEYLQIGELLEELKPPLVLACTATATPVVRDEIVARLGLGPDTPQLLRGFARPNLALRALSVASARDRDREVDSLLAEALGPPGAARGTAIVYAPTRRGTEEEASRLAARGFSVAAYHAGMEGAERTRAQRAFTEDEAETLAGCGRCDVCRAIGGDDLGDEETTLVVRKALSAVARVDRRFGLTAAVKLLAGAADPRLERAGLDRTPTFGALRDHSEAWLTQLVRRCVTAGWVDFTSGDRPVVRLTAAGRAVMKAERPARLVLPREAQGGAPGRDMATPGGRTGRRVDAAEGLPAEAEPVFEALRRLRLELAREDRVPAFVVASDRTLRDVALLRPRTSDELQRAHGIGPAKAERYGPRILAAVARAVAPR